MNESEFNQAADTTLLAIEEAVEAAMDTLDGDVDFETSAGILTLTFDNGSKVIINRQVATREIWVAARSGGFHCGRKNDGWFCNTTGETLSALVSRVCSEQSGETMVLAF
ncbi:MAG: iron donor protein CyaY [bacterium]|nr:iron donor protein CyaY [bacterium]